MTKGPRLRFLVNSETGHRELWLGTGMKLGEVVSVVGYHIKIFDGRNTQLANRVPYYSEDDAARVLMRDVKALVKTIGVDNLCRIGNESVASGSKSPRRRRKKRT